MWIIINAVFFCFLHYQSQYRHLDPQHYNVQVITSEDYQNLSNPENLSVKLSNGSTVTNRAESWASSVLPMYKSANYGSQYVLVTLKGTAPFMTHFLSIVLPIFVVSLLALYGQFSARHQKNENMQQA